MSTRPDWPAVRAAYVEGHATDPDADPNARTWPTLEEVAALHGVSYRAVAQHSSRERWPALREEFQRQVDEERRRLLAEDRGRKVASIDGRALTSADAGLALVGRRLGLLVRTETDRGNDAGKGVDAAELAALGLAARRWVQVKDMVIGKAVEDVPDEAVQERDQRVAEQVLAAKLAEHVAERLADVADEERAGA